MISKVKKVKVSHFWCVGLNTSSTCTSVTKLNSKTTIWYTYRQISTKVIFWLCLVGISGVAVVDVQLTATNTLFSTSTLSAETGNTLYVSAAISSINNTSSVAKIFHTKISTRIALGITTAKATANESSL